METWDAITARRNVREFTDEPLSDQQLRRILEAAWRAPSSRNGQPWDFVAVTERSQLEELSKVWRGGGHIAGAAAAVAMLIPDSDDAHTRETNRYDLGQAAMQMMIAAADMGIGSGHSAVGDQELARRILGHPQDRIAALIIDFGHPADRPLAPIRKPDRRPFDDVVHFGHW
ncbi:MAG TPA: nitroreductase family protein [Solirubrobacteraceae bacterium]|nr:nitroreductase family protein [Solirubrobacteraceae bacterium]